MPKRHPRSSGGFDVGDDVVVRRPHERTRGTYNAVDVVGWNTFRIGETVARSHRPTDRTPKPRTPAA